jgi:hypothetical protein
MKHISVEPKLTIWGPEGIHSKLMWATLNIPKYSKVRKLIYAKYNIYIELNVGDLSTSMVTSSHYYQRGWMDSTSALDTKGNVCVYVRIKHLFSKGTIHFIYTKQWVILLFYIFYCLCFQAGNGN